NFIGVAGMAMAAGCIGVETIIWRRGEHNAVTINIDVAPTGSTPSQVHGLLSPHLIGTRSEHDLAGCRCWCSCGSDGRGGSYRRSWSWACGRELEFADARKPAGATGDRIILVSVPET